MGLISFIFGYSIGRRGGARRTAKENRRHLDDMYEQCAVCGYYAMQHDADGYCPDYP